MSARNIFHTITLLNPRTAGGGGGYPQDKVNKMAPATTADELVKQLKRVWGNIQPCAGEPGGGNALSDA